MRSILVAIVNKAATKDQKELFHKCVSEFMDPGDGPPTGLDAPEWGDKLPRMIQPFKCFAIGSRRRTSVYMINGQHAVRTGGHGFPFGEPRICPLKGHNFGATYQPVDGAEGTAIRAAYSIPRNRTWNGYGAYEHALRK